MAGKVEFITVEETGSTSITYGETELTGTQDARCVEEYTPEGKPSTPAWGWAATDGMLSLADCGDAKDITVKEGNLTIQAAGLNRINTLVSDSVVNIIGSGILLLEEAKLGENGEVNLLTNNQYADTGVEGSVAVFLRQKDAPGETYRLMNGSVPGILDGSYTIPSGINLIVPDGSSLIMNSFVATAKEGEDNRYQYYSGDTSSVTADIAGENSAQLTIASGASLTVEKGASVRMITTQSRNPDHLGEILTPKIKKEIGGKLAMSGAVTGTGGMITQANEDDSETVVVMIQDTDTLIDKLLEQGHKCGEKVGFAELEAAWESVYPDSIPDNSVISIKVDGKETIITRDGGEQVQIPGGDLHVPDWSKIGGGVPYTGTGLTQSWMTITGVGLVLTDIVSGTPGKNADGKPTFTSTGSTTILPEKLAAKTQEQVAWRVVVTENPERGTWTLSVYVGDVPITDLGVATVRVRFKFDLPDGWNGKNIYVVFLDKNGNLRAIPATYNAVTGELVFDSSLVGEFVVVTFDYQGELYSKDFYTELAKLDAVKHLIDLHSGKAG